MNADIARQIETARGTPLRKNWNNTGKAFQREMELTAEAYSVRGIAKLAKVDPPVRVMWIPDKHTGEKVQRVIFRENPFLDYLGTWTERNGRALFIEAKSTQTERLPFNGDSGLKDKQWEAMKAWRIAGAACALVWQFDGRVALFTPESMLVAEATGAKSLKHGDGWRVPAGVGAIVWDFLPVLAAAIWGGPLTPAEPENQLQIGLQ